MKTSLISVILLLFISFNSFSQTKVDSLSIIQDRLRSQIKLLQDSISRIEKMKEIIKSNELFSKISNQSITATIRKDVVLRKGPDPTSESIKQIKAGQKVILKDYVLGYCGICDDNSCGYVNELWFEKDSQFLAYVNYHSYKLEMEQKLLNEKDGERFKEWERNFIKKHGQKVYTDIKLGRYWIGMTDEMARMSLGYPEKNNKTVGVWGVHEQWVYPNDLYLYFENGILTTYQKN